VAHEDFQASVQTWLQEGHAARLQDLGVYSNAFPNFQTELQEEFEKAEAGNVPTSLAPADAEAVTLWEQSSVRLQRAFCMAVAFFDADASDASDLSSVSQIQPGGYEGQPEVLPPDESIDITINRVNGWISMLLVNVGCIGITRWATYNSYVMAIICVVIAFGDLGFYLQERERSHGS